MLRPGDGLISKARLAEEVFPVIEVGAGRTVDIVVSRGLIVTTRMDLPEK